MTLSDGRLVHDVRSSVYTDNDIAVVFEIPSWSRMRLTVPEKTTNREYDRLTLCLRKRGSFSECRLLPCGFFRMKDLKEMSLIMIGKTYQFLQEVYSAKKHFIERHTWETWKEVRLIDCWHVQLLLEEPVARGLNAKV